VQVLASTRSGAAVPGAARSLGPADLDELLVASDYVVLCAPLTAETHGLIGARELELLGPRGVLVNVGRGGSTRRWRGASSRTWRASARVSRCWA
jgi:phosphoglycerate dehydrogenase-like enzyme